MKFKYVGQPAADSSAPLHSRGGIFFAFVKLCSAFLMQAYGGAMLLQDPPFVCQRCYGHAAYAAARRDDLSLPELRR